MTADAGLSPTEQVRARSAAASARRAGPGRLERLRFRAERLGQAFLAWQADIEDQGRIVMVGLALAALGLLLVWPPAAALVPGLVLVLVGLGFDFRHPATATALVAGVSVIVAVAIIFGGAS